MIGDDAEAQASFHKDVMQMRSLGASWKSICESMGVEIKFLSRWRKGNKFIDPLRSDISDAELDQKLLGYMEEYSHPGEVMLNSCLILDDCRVIRKRLRASIKRVHAMKTVLKQEASVVSFDQDMASTPLMKDSFQTDPQL